MLSVISATRFDRLERESDDDNEQELGTARHRTKV
jgi:hypothetical protein